jgi:uncharacterized membrane protein
MLATDNPTRTSNLGLVERWASILAGAALVGYGVKKRSAARTAAAILGGDLVLCGLTGRSRLYNALGLGRSREKGTGRGASIPYEQGIRIDESVTIDKPREEIYTFWRNLENLPRFMQHVQSVTRIDERRSHWVVRGPAGKNLSWDAEIINEEAPERIGWRSLPGSDVDTAGSVQFLPAAGGHGTELKIELQYNPPGGALGAALAKILGEDPVRQIRGDLYRLKQYFETGEMPPMQFDEAARRRPSRARRMSPGSTDEVQEASEDSFPASDAPSWTAPNRGERAS